MKMPAYGIMYLLAFVLSGMGVVSAQSTQPDDNGGYLFVTFKGEATPMTEQIYFGLSPDGFHWDALNDANPVLVSDVGEKGVFAIPICFAPTMAKSSSSSPPTFPTILTANWHRATHAGSKSIVIWESDDLVKWSAPRLVKVAPDDAGCTWAPEAIYDEETRTTLFIGLQPPRRDNFAKQRIWSAHTTDFKEFSRRKFTSKNPATVYDTDIIRDGNKYYRFSKDSAGEHHHHGGRRQTFRTLA
jgi:hypothetical protein